MNEQRFQDDRASHSLQFQRQAEEPSAGILREFLDFLVHNKKWWLAPIVLVLLLLGLLVFLGGTGLAPFIYTVF